MKTALIVVDIQNDFTPGGSLGVSDGDQTALVANKLAASGTYDLIVATQDWHPANHSSFVSNNPNGIWPDHCVQGTVGAEMHPSLDVAFDKIFPKGTNPEVDSYSGFFDNDKKSDTGLDKFLRDNNIEAVDIVGLATDYCVKATALDAASLGFKTTVIREGCKAVNIAPDDEEKAYSELEVAGVAIKTS